MTLTDLCNEIKNWFDVSRHYGEFEIKNGTIDLDFLSEGQFFRIIGSTFNDGVYQYSLNDLKDDKFDGAIWAMAVPPAVLELLDRINEYTEKYSSSIDSPYQSESFGGYSYSKENNGNVNWKSKFSSELNRWRKI